MNNQKLMLFLSFLIMLSLGSTAQQSKKITMDDLMKDYTFSSKSVYGLRSMNDGVHYTTLEDKGTKIVKYSYASGEKVANLLKTSKLTDSDLKYIGDYEFSADESSVLLMTNKERIYRHSFLANYYIYKFRTKELKALSPKGKQRLASFSPDGKYIAFVRENNIYIHNIAFGTERQITKDGEYNHIQNGTPDWVYEEEFAFSKGFEWSPDSKSIAYMRFDESKVPMFNMTKFEGLYPQVKNNALYPENYVYKYPKAGETNSVVEVHVYNLSDKTTQKMDVGAEKDQYIPRIRWTADAKVLSIFRFNRHQNKFEILLANSKTGKSNVMFKEENKYFVSSDYLDDIAFLDDNQHFIYLSERDGYNHIYLFDMSGRIKNQVTKGNWDVTKYLGYDAKKKVFYYESAEVSPLERNIFSIKENGSKKKNLTPKKGTNRVVFSKGFKYYINYFSSTTQPNFVSLYNAKGKQIRVLEDNKDLVAKLKQYNYNTREFIKLPAADGKTSLNAYIIKPFNFDENKKYPVLMTQYSGPNSQQVKNAWSFDWYNYLAQEGYIVVCVDGRGTAARGEEFRKCTYMKLGKLESDDQISAAKALGEKPYVNADKIAIWGWSYGGFMSSLCLEKANDVFAAAIAVAPVTSWRYYNTIYTERYMRTPQENPSGYDDNSPIQHVDKLKGSLLLCHGTSDDNVHIQNVYEFAERLVQADKQFEMQIYTNRNHSIYGGNTRLHLYKRFNKFLKDNL